jgi:6,7-dimethyl-8-ribityllumazine synthase
VKVLIVEAPYYEEISEELFAGAVEEIERLGGAYERLTVPGALEIPGAIRLAADASEAQGNNTSFHAYVALGCVIRGETSHYDYVCGESARGLMDLTLQGRIAVGNGILTVENRDQAWARASREQKNKGRDAAGAALALAALKQQFGLA